MRFHKKAFTLTELMIALAVIGVLTAILLPVIRNLMPDQNVLMAKRANYTIESVVSNMLNDSACYPPGNGQGALSDWHGYADCELWGGERDDINEGSSVITSADRGNFSAGTKFKRIFIDKLQLAQRQADGEPDYQAVFTTFTTKDGMRWAISAPAAEDDNHVYNISISVDVNGAEGPNACDIDNLFGDANPNARGEYDIAVFNIDNSGNVTTPDNHWAMQAIDVNTSVTGR